MRCTRGTAWRGFCRRLFLKKKRSATINLKDRVGIITGAGSGIGKAIALDFAKEGAGVVLIGRRESALQEVAREVENFKAQAKIISADVSRAEDVERMVSQTVDSFGRIDILVNNAGTGVFSQVIDLEEAQWNQIIRTNLTGAFLCAKAVLPRMIEREYGRIINISSVIWKRGRAGTAPYSASKAGLVGFTRSLAWEVETKGITVNAICPGWVNTEMAARSARTMASRYGVSSEEEMDIMKSLSPQQRIIEPEEVAYLASFLASDKAKGMTAQVIDISGIEPNYSGTRQRGI